MAKRGKRKAEIPARSDAPETKKTGLPAGWYWRAGTIVVLALLLRLVAVGFMQANDPFADRLLPTGDELSFQLWAERIAAGDWPGAGHYIQAPLYPYAVAVLFKLAGPRLALVRHAQALLDAGTTALLMLLAVRLFSPAAALLAGLLYALSPVAMFFTTCILRDSPMPFFLTLVLLLALRANNTTDWRRWLALGAGCGLAHLCRENFLTVTVLFAGWCLGCGELRRAWRWTLLPLLAGTMLVMLPAGLRNLAVGVNPFVITENGQVALIMGNAADAAGVGYIVPPSAEKITREHSGLPATAFAIMRGHAAAPWGLLQLYLRKAHALLSNLEIANNENFYYARARNPLLALPLPGFGFAWTLALAGITLALTDRQQRRAQALTLLVLAVYAATVLLFFILSRFRLPLLPLLCGYAGFALVETANLLRRRNWGRVVLAGAVAGLTAAASFTPTGYEREHGELLYRDYTTRAQMAMAAGELVLAEDFLRLALANRPNYAMAQLKLGIVLVKSGDTAAARDVFATATQLQPAIFEAWMNLGLTQLAAGDTAGAAVSYRRALTLQPNNALAREQVQYLSP